MKTNKTILLKDVDLKEIYKNINSVFVNNEIIVIGETENWEKIKIIDDQNTITLTSMIGEKPMDQFSKLVLGLFNYINRNSQAESKEKQLILDKIANANMAIGIVSELEIGEEKLKSLKPIFEALEATIFDGENIIDFNSNILA